jgi:cellulose synthase/poly-beta-1,6-N-acetylglucosamine synthase-like glycosyltransferase
LSLGLAWLAERRYRQLPAVPEGPAEGRLPSLSIVIPARNEARNLPTLLASLDAVCYKGRVEIIVVDDDSQDGTAEIASAHGAQVVRLDGPPSGWSGKAYACHRGVAAAQGEWILFTDADTRHTPGGPGRVVSLALDEGWDGLSLFVAQDTHGPADLLGLMVAYAGYFVSLGNPAGALNGQYVLLRRAVYVDSGGYSTVPREVTEDLALGHHLAQLGYQVPLLRGDDVASVRMYRETGQLWQGLARFGVSSLRWSGASGMLAVLYTILLAAPVELLLTAVALRHSMWPGVLNWLVTAAGLLPWAHRFGGRRWALLGPLGAIQVQFAAIWGILRRLGGRGVRWKERVL